MIEETQNRQAGRLDLAGPDAPFCTPGSLNCAGTTARSTFEVLFAVVLPNGMRLHNVRPLHMEAVITEKPPHTLYRHVIPEPIQLFDDNNRPTGIFLVKAEHDTRPREIDHFASSGAAVGLRMPDGNLVNVVMTGPATVSVALDSLQDSPTNGLEEVNSDLIQMNLTDIARVLLRGRKSGRRLRAAVRRHRETATKHRAPCAALAFHAGRCVRRRTISESATRSAGCHG